MFPTNKAGEAGIIDYAGRLVTNDNISQMIAERHAFRSEYHKSLTAGAIALMAFDPSLNLAVRYTYKVNAGIRSTESPINMELYEGARFIATGTEIPVYNFNRNNECPPLLSPYAKMYHTPTVDSSGNKYAPDIYVHASTSGPGRLTTTAGSVADDIYMYLSPAKKYLWKFTNIGSTTTRLDVNVRVVREIDYKAGGR